MIGRKGIGIMEVQKIPAQGGRVVTNRGGRRDVAVQISPKTRRMKSSNNITKTYERKDLLPRKSWQPVARMAKPVTERCFSRGVSHDGSGVTPNMTRAALSPALSQLHMRGGGLNVYRRITIPGSTHRICHG